MKTLLSSLAVLILGIASFAGALPCDGKDAKAKGNCPLAEKRTDNSMKDCTADCRKAAKAAYEETLEKTGCTKSAQAAANVAMAKTAYHASFEAKHCSKSATRAAYEAVYKATGCSKSANAAATQAARELTYEETLAATGCSKSAGAAAEEAEKSASMVLSNKKVEAEESAPTEG